MFGEIAYDRSWWETEIEFAPIAAAVALNIRAAEHGPTDEQRALYRELVDRYTNLLPQIGDSLWELYRPWREEFAKERRTNLGAIQSKRKDRQHHSRGH